MPNKIHQLCFLFPTGEKWDNYQYYQLDDIGCVIQLQDWGECGNAVRHRRPRLKALLLGAVIVRLRLTQFLLWTPYAQRCLAYSFKVELWFWELFGYFGMLYVLSSTSWNDRNKCFQLPNWPIFQHFLPVTACAGKRGHTVKSRGRGLGKRTVALIRTCFEVWIHCDQMIRSELS